MSEADLTRIGTPALLGLNHPNEQEYFLHEKFGF